VHGILSKSPWFIDSNHTEGVGLIVGPLVLWTGARENATPDRKLLSGCPNLHRKQIRLHFIFHYERPSDEADFRDGGEAVFWFQSKLPDARPDYYGSDSGRVANYYLPQNLLGEKKKWKECGPNCFE